MSSESKHFSSMVVVAILVILLAITAAVVVVFVGIQSKKLNNDSNKDSSSQLIEESTKKSAELEETNKNSLLLATPGEKPGGAVYFKSVGNAPIKTWENLANEFTVLQNIPYDRSVEDFCKETHRRVTRNGLIAVYGESCSCRLVLGEKQELARTCYYGSFMDDE